MPDTYESVQVQCGKNPGHKNFVAITEFNITYLAPRYQDNDIVDLIKAQADVTFRLSSTSVSESRPLKSPAYDKIIYPFYDYRGRKDVLRIGSGWMEKVVKFTENDDKNCRCEECVASDRPRKIWGEIWLRTCAHHIFDTSEATNTTCYFFHDTANIDLSKVFSLRRMEVIDSDLHGGWCLMKHYTHDLDLLDRMGKLCQRYCDLRDKVCRKYKDFRSQMKLAVIVSHPHGCPKQVTIGEWVERRHMDGKPELTQYFYTTPTCPGTGGARVYIFGAGNESNDHAHMARTEDGRNQSTYALEK